MKSDPESGFTLSRLPFFDRTQTRFNEIPRQKHEELEEPRTDGKPRHRQPHRLRQIAQLDAVFFADLPEKRVNIRRGESRILERSTRTPGGISAPATRL